MTFLKNMMFLMALNTVIPLTAWAVSLSPGEVKSLAGTSTQTAPQLAGTVIVDDIIPFNYDGVSGTVQQRVVQAKDGSVDFYWRIINDAKSQKAITEFSYIEGYTQSENPKWSYNVDWVLDGLGDVAPQQASRIDDSTLSAPLTFHFAAATLNDPKISATGILPGQSSKFFYIDTNEKNYEKAAGFTLQNASDKYSSFFEAFRLLKQGASVISPDEIPVDCTPVYDNGLLDLICVDVPDNLGGVQRYHAKLALLPNTLPLTFQLLTAVRINANNDSSAVIPSKQESNLATSTCVAQVKDDQVILPCVEVLDAVGRAVKFSAVLKMRTEQGNLLLELMSASISN